ncbi:uncharacterized protein BO88DRAFT_452379 [Aspergillus vadensis CBS 113365]|uniref:Uncharacterized protein n=1 Tax=Aspergillus vadensis (strain CBS 113365 / IMI 142717 / IBT 24658) TaxID=1448311 RepID=A0A319BY87_ASPVC|nr:hypothetical protein BO88DRAFT_452379 [Aspergillus vadensis CBS 113365]PYH70863.1 hypothetical protein BO88DRAFT_452379 [Aspergillus vadensis CBS 113365]
MAAESPTSHFTAEMLVTLEMFKDSPWEEPVPVSPFWDRIYALQDELNLPEAEQTVRMLVDKTPYKLNPVPAHMLAEHLVNVGEYEEAERIERPIRAWMAAWLYLGLSSPQALNARRLIAQALWGQGPSRRSEAEDLIAEIYWIVEEMGEGHFAVYQAEERRLNQVMMATLR